MFSFTRHPNAQSGFSNDDVKRRPGQVVEFFGVDSAREKKCENFGQKF